MDLSYSSALSSVSQNSVSSDVVDESCVPSGNSLNALTEEIVAYEKGSDETHAVKTFIKAFRKTPSIVVTDQYRAMRNAIEAEFAGSKHRLCMWHITQKLPAKNMHIGPEEFEYRWGKLMEEFKLENHKWLTKMFNISSTWTLAYFIDSLLCGLTRTTSRSESENSSFVITNSEEIFVGLWHCQIDLKSLVEGSEVCIIKESPCVYEMLKKKKPQSLDKGKDKAKEEDIVDLFFKKDGLYKKDVEADCPNPPSKNKTDNLEQLVGVSKPDVVDVNNPYVGSTKGRRNLRIRGEKEKAIEKSLKGKNSC
nr:hypothetical protein [Tanacetum cinerariifolium]